MENCFDYLKRDEQHQIQQAKLLSIVPYCINNPFYKNKLRNLIIDKTSLSNLELFASIPFTTKEELRSSNPFDRTAVKPSEISFLFSSSGTTGEPTVYVWTLLDSAILKILAKRAMERIKINQDDLALILAPFGMSIMWYCMMTQYSTLNAGVIPLGISDPDEILKTVTTLKPTIITSIPDAALRLYEFRKNNNYNGSLSSIKQFHFGGDFLSDSKRNRIEMLWQVPCFDFYGLSEIMGPIAGECLEKKGLHFASDYIFIEILDPVTLKPVGEGEDGVAVYTTLWQKGAPLLRYWSDDIVSVNYNECACGRSSPRVFYKGRLKDSFLINTKRFYIKDLENIILRYDDVGNEWEIEICNEGSSTIANLKVEIISSDTKIERKLQTLISDFLSIQCYVTRALPGTFLRNNRKVNRLFDKREI